LQVIVHGSAQATRHLAEYCRQNNVVQGNIFTPTLGEVIDATIESHIFQVTLSDQLMSSLSFQMVVGTAFNKNIPIIYFKVKDAELSWLDARILRKSALPPTALETEMEEGTMEEEEEEQNEQQTSAEDDEKMDAEEAVDGKTKETGNEAMDEPALAEVNASTFPQ
jgi:hypothetical protein